MRPYQNPHIDVEPFFRKLRKPSVEAPVTLDKRTGRLGRLTNKDLLDSVILSPIE